VILNHDFKSKSGFWFWFQISSCKVISIFDHWFYWFCFFEIFKITHHVHDVQCCSNLEFCQFTSIVSPCPTRWNSKLDAVKRLLELGDNIGPIGEELGKPKLKQVEVDFLEEYVTVMEPLAVVLGQLQGDRHCCYRMLVPMLTQLRYKLSLLAADNLTYCNPLATSLLST